ncbi:hypothetical protein J27TS8_16840 [Robertmurraya siralis]|uniref:DUF7973 domain-containing protein n=1 Tax=Robertmurraya siralis TaxID=77777 RepID=A0A919WGR8_9BACI|nr:hypothetical protein [Robertmurraya siralis]PAE21526.1 hypothetical protein CHH80_06405 [Bacillus sp. 7504-2]GIN61691.1 hypothetical protein J27TS8_16840 [Robertmurraya siralis]
MSWELILASFGGGVFGALFGALPAFIFAGFVGLIGVGVIAAGGPPTILNDVVFGTLLGPHIAFAGGVAAAAFAANKKKVLDSALDIVTPLKKTNDISVLLIGGMFGIIGHLINSALVHFETPVDTVALTVFISCVISRFVFGKSGLIGKFAPTNGEKRDFAPGAKSLWFIIIYSLGFGLVISYLVDLTQINVLGFVISASLLILLQFGFDIPATHHITLVAGYATIATGSILYGALFAVIAGVLGEIADKTFNSYVDTYIDPPATTIFICSFFIFVFM